MRLAGQQRLGFYPAHPQAIAELVKHLRCKPPDPTKKADSPCILDPCCGKGTAIKQIADALGVPEPNVFTVELDTERGKAVKELIPGGNHISPASFLGCQITGSSFGLAYVNPPFDNELGGGRREEEAFAQRAIPLLVTNGILVLVLPLSALAGNRSLVQLIDAHFDDVRVYKFPDAKDHQGQDIRAYHEVVILGRKRKEPLPKDMLHRGTLHQMELHWRNYFRMEHLPALGQHQPSSWNSGSPSQIREPELRTWEIPHSWRPNTFKKNMFTDEELEQELEKSPLNKRFEEVPPLEPHRPPLSLDKGHLGLILASGVLDGLVHGPFGTHVVRGSSHKKTYHDKESSESTENPESGAMTTKDVYRERMITVIRCAVDYPEPGIFTFSNDNLDEKEETADEDDEV
jgi:hypothetical protein